MEITIRYTQDCPHVEEAERNVRQALRALGMGAAISRQVVSTSDEASELGFLGSPTILIDGNDPFAEVGAGPGLACRIYRTPDGPAGAPRVAELRDALQRDQ